MGSVTLARVLGRSRLLGCEPRTVGRALACVVCPILACLLWACGGDTPQTLVMVEVASELQAGTELSAVVVVLSDPEGEIATPKAHSFPLAADKAQDGHNFPFSFAVKRGVRERFRMRISGEGPGEGGDEVVERIAVTQDIVFVSGQTRTIQVMLPRVCMDVQCEAGLTCYVEATETVASGECGPIDPQDAVAVAMGDAAVMAMCDVEADLVCDDGLFCNGQERCEPGQGADALGCVPGEAAVCAAGQVCVEQLQGCALMPDLCANDGACDDGTFCNGQERCDPEHTLADARGCAPGEPLVCGEEEVCLEREQTCSACGLNGDGDDDGYDALACGGDDCSDHEFTVHPGQPELCDGLDNDCDGRVDEEADGSCEAPMGGTVHCVASLCLAACPEDTRQSEDGTRCDWQDDCAFVDACGPAGECVDGVLSFTCKCAPGYHLAADGDACQAPSFRPAVPLSAGEFYRLQDVDVVAGAGGMAALWAGAAADDGVPALWGRVWVPESGWGEAAQLRLLPDQVNAFRTVERVAAVWRPAQGAGAWFVGDGRLYGTALAAVPETSTWGFSPAVLHADAELSLPLALQAVHNARGQALLSWAEMDGAGMVQSHLELREVDGQLRSAHAVLGIDPATLHLGMDAMGRALVVSERRHWTYDESGWSSPPAGEFVRAPVVLGSGGRGAGGETDLSRFQFGPGFANPEPVAPAINPLRGAPARLGVDQQGNVLVVWADGAEVMARRFDAASASWNAAAPLPSLGGDEVTEIQVAMAAFGEALVAYRGSNRRTAWVHHYVPQLGFSPPLAVEVDPPDELLRLQVVLSDQGHGGLLYVTFSMAKRHALWFIPFQ